MEAPDECGHRHEIENKKRSIEIIDEVVLGSILEALDEYDDFKIMILPDHPTPLALRTHTNDPVPFLIYRKTVKADGAEEFTEETAKASGLFIENGPEIMKYFIDL